MATRELAPNPFAQTAEVESAPQIGADFCLSGKAFMDYVLDGTSGNTQSLDFNVVSKIQTHLKDLTDQSRCRSSTRPISAPFAG